MKKILSLILAFSFFASEASFMDKVKALPGKAKEFALATKDAAKEFALATKDAAKANKPKAIFTTLQIAVAARRLYDLGKPELKINPLTKDENNFLSFGKYSPLSGGVLKLYSKIGNTDKIANKNLKPIKYVQDFFNDGIGGTLFILEILKRLTTKAE